MKLGEADLQRVEVGEALEQLQGDVLGITPRQFDHCNSDAL